MVQGMSLQSFTLIHVLMSLSGIASGLVVVYGFLTNKRLDAWTAVFLATTALTSLKGFLFPSMGVTPAVKLEVISLVVLAIYVCDALPAPHYMAKNLCDWGVRGIVFQRLRSGGAVV